jgi:plastocyanin
MHSLIRVLAVPALAGLLAGGVVLVQAIPSEAASPRVLMYDNDGPLPNRGMDARTGEFEFSPRHITVMKGEMVTFVNPAGNMYPHDVVSLTRSGSDIQVGAAFSSGMTNAEWVRAGNQWVLDTTNLDPNHYGYLCTLHPWMNGSITVVAP